MKEDYYLTPDKLWIPLRWIAPELLEEYRGSLIVTDQTKTSNVWYVVKALTDVSTDHCCYGVYLNKTFKKDTLYIVRCLRLKLSLTFNYATLNGILKKFTLLANTMDQSNPGF